MSFLRPINLKKVDELWMEHRLIATRLPDRCSQTGTEGEEPQDTIEQEVHEEAHSEEGNVEDVDGKDEEGNAKAVDEEDINEEGNVKNADDEETNGLVPEEEDSEEKESPCCEESCSIPTDIPCAKCAHYVCLCDSIPSLYDPQNRVCGHCLSKVKEVHGTDTYDEDNDDINNNTPFMSNEGLITEAIDTSINQAPGQTLDEEALNSNEVTEALEADPFETDSSVPNYETETSLQEIVEERNCLFCSTKSKQIGVHLAASDVCRRKYCEALNLRPDSTVNIIMKCRKNARRQSCPSRQPEIRAMEYITWKTDQDNVQLLNTFIKNTNKTTSIFKCLKCRSNFKKEDVQKFNDDPSLQDNLKREGSFWMCKNCVEGNGIQNPLSPFQEHFELIDVDGRNIFIPASTSSETQATRVQQNFILPCSATSPFTRLGSREPSYRNDTIKDIYSGPGRFQLKEKLSSLYEHKMKQLKDASQFSSCLTGRIVDLDKKKVKILNPHMSTSKVKGSDDYYSLLNKEIRFAIYDLGSTFVIVRAKLPKDTTQVWASILMQLNNVKIDIIENKNEDGIVETQFKVHPTHNDKECDDNCEIIDLAEYRVRYPSTFLYGVLLPACVSSIHVRYNQLATLISSIQTLNSKRFHSTIQFPLMEDSAELVMMLWPDNLSELNKKTANSEALTEVDKLDLCSFVDGNLTASLDMNYLSQAFKLSTSLASKVAELAQIHQHHLHGGVSCLDCFQRRPPSNLTFMKDNQGIKLDLVKTWDRIKQAFEEQLDNLPLHMYQSNSEETLDGFLQHLEQMEGYSLVQDGSLYRLKLPMYPTFVLEVNDVLQYFDFNLLSAIYHRSISLSHEIGVEYVLMRPFLRDCFVLEYTPFILLASEARVETNVCGTKQKEAADNVTQAVKVVPQELQSFSVDHREVTPEEAIWLIDPKKKLIKRSIKPKYINTHHDKKLKFKVPVTSDPLHNFTDIEGGRELKLVEDMHDCYLERPALHFCTFDQFLVWYKDDASDEDKSEGTDQDDNPLIVTNLDYQGPPLRLPRSLVLDSGKRLTLRKIPKILSYPTPEEDSDDFVRLNVILYHPHKSYDQVQMKMEDMMKIFTAKDANPKKNGKGKELTKLETIRSLLHPHMNQQMWSKLFNKDEPEIVD